MIQTIVAIFISFIYYFDVPETFNSFFSWVFSVLELCNIRHGGISCHHLRHRFSEWLTFQLRLTIRLQNSSTESENRSLNRSDIFLFRCELNWRYVAPPSGTAEIQEQILQNTKSVTAKTWPEWTLTAATLLQKEIWNIKNMEYL